mmetsp:Transcript_51231/g.153913  ORF Transcript_51231/g.153913 Transcript_51231/m.153913 type:complete len:245 (+) Transcript_51231:394-1128(+)
MLGLGVGLSRAGVRLPVSGDGRGFSLGAPHGVVLRFPRQRRRPRLEIGGGGVRTRERGQVRRRRREHGGEGGGPIDGVVGIERPRRRGRIVRRIGVGSEGRPPPPERRAARGYTRLGRQGRERRRLDDRRVGPVQPRPPARVRTREGEADGDGTSRARRRIAPRRSLPRRRPGRERRVHVRGGIVGVELREPSPAEPAVSQFEVRSGRGEGVLRHEDGGSPGQGRGGGEPECWVRIGTGEGLLW